MPLANPMIVRASLFIMATACAGGVGAAYNPASPPSARLAAHGQTLERQVMAAFLFKFGQFVAWPPGAFADGDRPLVIGVIDASDIAEDLRQITFGQRIQGHPVAVRRLTVLGIIAMPKYGGNFQGVGNKLIGVIDRHVWRPPCGYYDKDYAGFAPYPGTTIQTA